MDALRIHYNCQLDPLSRASPMTHQTGNTLGALEATNATHVGWNTKTLSNSLSVRTNRCKNDDNALRVIASRVRRRGLESRSPPMYGATSVVRFDTSVNQSTARSLSLRQLRGPRGPAHLIECSCASIMAIAVLTCPCVTTYVHRSSALGTVTRGERVNRRQSPSGSRSLRI